MSPRAVCPCSHYSAACTVGFRVWYWHWLSLPIVYVEKRLAHTVMKVCDTGDQHLWIL